MTVRFSLATPLLMLAALALAALAGSTGCVRRSVTINSDPQGATVTLNDQEVGTTPASVEFTWYGDYDVILRKEGYRTLRTHQRLNSPWYQVPPIDFIAEILLPFTIHDRQQAFFALEPQQPMTREDLVKAAVEFRERTLFGEE
jgi:hypothetical protein